VKYFTLLFILAHVVSTSLPTAAWAEDLYLTIGESRTLPLPPRGKIYVSNGSVIKVKEVATRLIVTAKKLGKSSIRIGSRRWDYLVLHKGIANSVTELSKLFKSTMGLTLKVGPTSCEIYGELLRWTDWQKISHLQRGQKRVCQFRAQVHPLKVERVLMELKKVARLNGLSAPLVQLSEGLIQVPKFSNPVMDEYKAIYEPFGLKVMVNSQQLDIQPLISVKLYLTEVSRATSRNLGLSWGGDLQAQTLPNWQTTGGLGFKIDALENQGRAKILASPTLVSRSGGVSKFFAGGEVPLRTSQFRHYSAIQWKPYGISLEISPRADLSGNVSLKLKTEVSSIDHSVAIENLPGFKINRLNAEFDLKSGATIVLSGLVKALQGDNNSGLPFLKRLPLIGSFFRSDGFSSQRSELLIFVSPRIEAKNESHHLTPKWPKYELNNEH